jgi:protein-S-isoprenylcysteine O-methyltransferase Ste14
MSGHRVDDHPNVMVFPPLVLLAAFIVGGLLQWLVPTAVLASIAPAGRLGAGVLAAAVGVLGLGGGQWGLVRRGTNINPRRPTTALATSGIYRLTRNPIYLGATLASVGIALIFALDWLALLMVPAALVLHFGVVLREEAYLERKFGAAYRGYKARVPRYVWPL